MGFYTNEPDVVTEGVKYLRIVSFSYLLSAVTVIYLCVMRSVERVKISLASSIVAFVTNVGLNAVLILGLGPAPALGVEGAAIATLFGARGRILIVMIYAAVQNKKWFHLKLSYLVRADGGLLRDFFRYSTPVLLGETCWGGEFHAGGRHRQPGQLGFRGGQYRRRGAEADHGAHLRVCDATTVIVGKLIGAGKEEEARAAGSTPGAAERPAGRFFRRRWRCSSETERCPPDCLTWRTKPPSTFTSCFTAPLPSSFAVVQRHDHRGHHARRRGYARGLLNGRADHVADLPCRWACWRVMCFTSPRPFVQILMISDEFVKFFICIWRFKSMKWLTNVTR